MKPITTLLFLFFAVRAIAVDIPKGTFYFDNSKTRYASVKFLYGKSTDEKTLVVNMQHYKEDIWKMDIPETVYGMTHYFFSNTSLEEGWHDVSISKLKDVIVNERGERRTSTVKDVDNKPMIPGYTFVPENGEQWAQGTWRNPSDEGKAEISRTLPVMYVDIEENREVVEKDVYLNATYYIDAMGINGYSNIGSREAPLTTLIKGHGNYTFKGFDKKPFRLKMTEKQALLGMPKSKHFLLMAGADDNMGFLRNYMGFEMSRRMALPYTPRQEPIELVVNGSYRGIYFLTEKIRVEKDRVDITEQEDMAQGAENITGGWLVEIDNYDLDPHITVRMPDKTMWVTYHTPERLSAEQENFLQTQFDNMTKALYSSDTRSTEWEEYIDMTSLAKVFIVREIMHDEEGFHGSCYMYKEKGETKWHFGPVWDFGNAYNNALQRHIFTQPQFTNYIIDRAWRFPRFQEMVKELWGAFYNTQYASVDNFIDSFARYISTACRNDAVRWPKYGNGDELQRAQTFKGKMHEKVGWLLDQWGARQPAGIENAYADSMEEKWYDTSGRSISGCPSVSGIYLHKMGDTVKKVFIK